MAVMYERYNDFETASYFHNRCLEISIEFKYIEGEAQAHRGLGNCEKKVFNKFPAITSNDVNNTLRSTGCVSL